MITVDELRAWTEDFRLRIELDASGRKNQRFHQGGVSALKQVLAKLNELKTGESSHSIDSLPDAPAQYLFLRPDGDLELWRLTDSGWCDAGGVHYSSPLKRNPRLTHWGRARL